jgi:hypothetical protein
VSRWHQRNGSTPKTVSIVVPQHARDRLVERCGVDLSHADIRREVFSGIRELRWTRTWPDWLVGKEKARHSATAYVWPPDRSRAWAVLLSGEMPITVRTCYRARARREVM